MENENRYASKGVGGTALGLSIGALGAELLGGTWGNILNGNRNGGCNDALVSRYELSQANRIAELETEVKLRDSNIYTDGKILELYKYVDGRFNGVEAQICQQSVVNAQVTANLACQQNAINTLMGLTKTIIPIGNVCPEPMPALNSWTAPTATA